MPPSKYLLLSIFINLDKNGIADVALNISNSFNGLVIFKYSGLPVFTLVATA